MQRNERISKRRRHYDGQTVRSFEVCVCTCMWGEWEARVTCFLALEKQPSWQLCGRGKPWAGPGRAEAALGQVIEFNRMWSGILFSASHRNLFLTSSESCVQFRGLIWRSAKVLRQMWKKWCELECWFEGMVTSLWSLLIDWWSGFFASFSIPPKYASQQRITDV